jgi:hypothetical protein
LTAVMVEEGDAGEFPTLGEMFEGASEISDDEV